MSKKNDKVIVKVTPTLKSYLSTKGIINYGIPTAIVCLVIYYFLTKEAMPLINIAGDLLLPVLITVFICALTCVPGIKGDIKKGKAPAAALEKTEHPVYKCIAGSLVGQAIEFAILAMLVFAMIPGGILAAVATMSGHTELAIGKTTYWILKSIYSGVFVNYAMRWATHNTLAQYQKSLGTQVY